MTSCPICNDNKEYKNLQAHLRMAHPELGGSPERQMPLTYPQRTNAPAPGSLQGSLDAIGHQLEQLTGLMVQQHTQRPEPVQPQTQPFTMPTVQPTGFEQIGAFARAMGELRNYENTVIKGYDSLRATAMQEAVAAQPTGESDDVTDYALKGLIDMLKTGQIPIFKQKPQIPPPQAQGNNAALVPNAAVSSEVTTIENKDVEGAPGVSQDEIEKVIAELPDFVIQGIKDGEVSVEMAISAARQQAQGGDIDENKVREIYEAVKALPEEEEVTEGDKEKDGEAESPEKAGPDKPDAGANGEEGQPEPGTQQPIRS